MGKPFKKGLDYFPKMCNFYDDDKIFDLLYEWGPLGVTVYDVILTIVYQNGYYAEISKDKLSRMVIKSIGSKWAKQKDVVQVIDFCAELGLLSDVLLKRGVITSVGIQSRFYQIAVKLMKRRLQTDEYWLLGNEENCQGLLNAPKTASYSEERHSYSEEQHSYSEEQPIKEKKKKYIDIYKPCGLSDEVAKLFDAYLDYRTEKFSDKFVGAQIIAIIDDLKKLSMDESKQIEIIQQSIRMGWKGLFAVKEQKQSTKKPAGTKFNNFEQRSYGDLTAMLQEKGGQYE